MRSTMMAVVLILVAAPAMALPDYSQDIWYYDSEGNIVGWWSITCNGQRASGGTSTDVYEVFSMPCTTAEPFTCLDEGLNTLGNCGDYWCYSDGYVMSFNGDMVYDCEGLCVYGEGPGSTSNYCATCWKGTSSCPTRGLGRTRLPKPKTLSAALDIKMWEILAHLRR
jgi:Family of unknown function (DUF6289)